MNPTIHDSKIFESLDYSEKYVNPCEFYKCKFVKCNFRKCDLSEVDFDECVFEDCELTMAVLKNTGMREIKFLKCKLLGVDFSVCNTFRFEVGFTGCNLDYSIFLKLKMAKTRFVDCTLKEVEFAETDLSSAIFERCDMDNAGFSFTNLEKADLRTAFNYSIDPEQNRIKKAHFSYLGLAGLLDKYDIKIE